MQPFLWAWLLGAPLLIAIADLLTTRGAHGTQTLKRD
jgi:hypothetical protein